jgi:hypothetical protein
MMANLAFAIGTIWSLATQDEPPESALPFDAAQRNFGAAARDGLAAALRWTDGREWKAAVLVQSLVPRARDGLAALGVDRALADAWMQTILARALTGRTGARWQLARLDFRGGDVAAMTLDYAARQAEGAPVHTWS